MSSPKTTFYDNQATTIIKNLKKWNMEGYCSPDAASVVQKHYPLFHKALSLTDVAP